jgi:nucleoid-associated protein YgaU
MNDPAVKLALALSIIGGGLLAAIAFRPDPAVPHPAAPSWSELAALRNRRPTENTDSLLRGRNLFPAPSESPEADSSSRRHATVLAPLDNLPAAPALSEKYPGDGSANSTGGGLPIVPVREAQLSAKGPRLHKIVDGDTLPALAEQFLGSSQRGMEIFNANREVLSNPDLLPIGGELKIPQR